MIARTLVLLIIDERTSPDYPLSEAIETFNLLQRRVGQAALS